jgi:hypothetical protein
MSDQDRIPPEVTEEVPAASSAFVGRKDETESLLARLKDLHEGRGGVIGIRADSGLGKTYLVQEIVAGAPGQQAKALLIACRGSIHRAYYPLAGLVRTLLNIPPQGRSRDQYSLLEIELANFNVHDPGQTLARLLNILPVESTGSPDISVNEGEDRFDDTQVGATALVELADTLSGLFGEIARIEGGLCLIFDDLDEAHPLTINLFGKLVEKTGGSSVLLIATYGPTPPEELQTIAAPNLVTLTNLPKKPALAMAASMADAKRLSDAFGDAVWKATDGDPLFMALLIGDLKRAGHLEIKQGAASMTGGDTPSNLIQLITAHAASLTDSQRETLICAAVLGDGFRMGALSAMRGRIAASDLEADLNALVDEGWLDRIGKGRQMSYVFTHRIQRNVIYKNIPDERRMAFHKNAGDYYAVVTAGHKIRVEYAMYHYLRSGDARRALPVIEIAINKVRASGERDRLAALYKMGIEAASADPTLGAKQIEMAEHLGDMVASTGDYAQAVDIYTRYSPPVTSPMVLGKLGLATLPSDAARAANVLSRAIAALGFGGDEDARWSLEASLCWALYLAGNTYEAIRRCRDALGKLGDTVGFGAARSLMRAMLGMILFYEGDLQEANPHLESARAGWGARGQQEGVLLVNQVLISMPKPEITRLWLKMIFAPLLKQ